MSLFVVLLALLGADPDSRYAARPHADRIILSPGNDPAREASVAFRTDPGQTTARAEIAPALEGPGLEQVARPVDGISREIRTVNGEAVYHQVRFTGLAPETPYAYRVRGADGWSEWLQFRTASAEAEPFRFVYLGDVQNDILANGARTVRQALKAAPDAALVVHGGDLVAQGRTGNHDDEWGQWTEAGGYAYAMIPQLPVAGNHEYVAAEDPQGRRIDVLGPHWPLQFVLPGGGAPGLEQTTFILDHQGVRFIGLDGTAALADPELLRSQTEWLRGALDGNPGRWSVVVMHQPVFTCARPTNTPLLEAAWRPVLEASGADLVLQGHDHCYSRISQPPGFVAEEGEVGPIYVVSIAGPKMYQLNARAVSEADRVAEDTQLYQVIEVAGERLQYRAYTVAGRLYDAFDLEKSATGERLVTPALPGQARVCEAGQGPDGLACSGRDLRNLR
ncbi:metallophosphoesterase [Brevundimonas sp. GCM10030266]|uniref:metallophosphoesterase n=1 Tax=Brevundimonas sp. GCM10030266 TaxID=3273386 RepID=UPI003608AE0C